MPKPPPTGGLSKLCDIRDWQDPEFRAIAADLMGMPVDAVPVHRKVWEFARVIRALREQGVWHDRAIGLSVAGGRELFLFFAANRILRMVSTDIYGLGDFARREADEKFLRHPERDAPIPFRAENLRVGRMNALDLLFSEGLFDFTVSFSSIEHFGGLRPALLALREMARVTRPGGVLAFTTECSLNGFTTNEVFTQRQISDLVGQSGCELIAPIDFSLSDESRRHLCDMLRDDLTELPHLNLKLRAAIFTSACVVLKKPGQGPAADADIAVRLGAIEEAIARSRDIPAEELLPRRGIFGRARARIAQKLRGAKYRLQERLMNHYP